MTRFKLDENKFDNSNYKKNYKKCYLKLRVTFYPLHCTLGLEWHKKMKGKRIYHINNI